MIVPFKIPWDPEGLADLKHRLGVTRWSDAVVSDWSYGMERGLLAAPTLGRFRAQGNEHDRRREYGQT